MSKIFGIRSDLNLLIESMVRGLLRAAGHIPDQKSDTLKRGTRPVMSLAPDLPSGYIELKI
jgi:hypothetical protein